MTDVKEICYTTVSTKTHMFQHFDDTNLKWLSFIVFLFFFLFTNSKIWQLINSLVSKVVGVWEKMENMVMSSSKFPLPCLNLVTNFFTIVINRICSLMQPLYPCGSISCRVSWVIVQHFFFSFRSNYTYLCGWFWVHLWDNLAPSMSVMNKIKKQKLSPNHICTNLTVRSS